MKIFVLLLVICGGLIAGDLGWIRAQGDSIVDEQGKRLHFRGIHITNESWGYWEWPVSDSLDTLGNKDPFMPQKTFPSYTLEDSDFQNIHELNPFLVRYELCYNVFASDNPLQSSNMALLKKHVKRFNDMGIYVVLDLHFGPGLNLSSAKYEDKNPGELRAPTVFEDSTLFKQLCNWWKYVAQEFRENPGIAGYQIIVEPRVPSEKDGGWDIYKKRMIELCEQIREVDPRHLLITHHVHSREVNPGEMYWKSKAMVTDTGEQGILWAGHPDCYTSPIECFPLIPLPNIIYSFSMYEPFGFTTEGVAKSGSSFSDENIREAVNNAVKIRADFGIKHNVPILVDEYGVNHFRTETDMLRWLKIVHEIYDEYNLPSWYFQYKGGVNPFTNVKDVMGLYSYFVTSSDIIEVTGTDYTFKGTAAEKVKETGFKTLFETYFWDDGTIKSLSKTGHDELYTYMKRYLDGPAEVSVNDNVLTTPSTIAIEGNHLQFSKSLTGEHTVSLFDLKGKRIWNGTLHSGTKQYTVPPFSQGIYILKITGSELLLKQKFLIL